MHNTPIGFKVLKDNVLVDIDYSINIDTINYNGTSEYSTIIINHPYSMSNNNVIYLKGNYEGVNLNKLYLYNQDRLITDINITNINNIVLNINKILNADIYNYLVNINITEIKYVIFKLYYLDEIARESNTVYEDLLVLHTIKTSKDIDIVYKKGGNYKLIVEVVDLYDNLYTTSDTSISIDTGTDINISYLKNKTNYIEWE